MMVSFFKRKSSGGLENSSPRSVLKSHHVKRVPRSPTTPPLTPEPGSPDSSLQVLIVTEPKENHSEKSHGSEKSQGSNDSGSDYGSISETLSIGIQSHTGNSLLSTVINGIGCMPVSELPSWTSRAGGSLITIPENAIIPPTPIWGVAPSFDSDSESFESLQRNIHYDNFEMVLDECNLENDKMRKRLDESMNNLANNEANQQEIQKAPLYCQPCNVFSERGQETNSELRNIEDENTRSETISPRDVSKAVPMNEKRKKEAKVLKKTKKKYGFKGAIELSVKLGDSLSSNKEILKKTLFHRKLPKIKQKNEGMQPKSSRFEKLMTKRFHNRKDDERKTNNKELQLSSSTATQRQLHKNTGMKEGRWKCAKDVKSGDVYFYHTDTKEVSWEQPESFVEWRATADLTTGKICFVNRITKEATWLKPEGFQEWREVIDATTGNTYYYNIISRETSWIKPNEEAESKEDIKIIDCITICSEEKDELKDREAGQETKKENVHPNVIQNDVEKNNPCSAVIGEDEATQDETTRNDKMPSETTISEDNTDDSLPMISLSEKLASLLSKYCPNEKEMNLQLIQKSVGQEALVIKAIQALVNETPFDELQLSIFSYAKSVIRSMGEEPYDETLGVRERRGPPVTLGRSSFRRVQTMNSAAFSLNSRAVSQMTGKSGLTNKTNGTAETFRMTNTTKVIDTNLDRSYEEDSTTDEDDGKKLIFDIRFLQEDKEKMGNKREENAKLRSTPLTTKPMTQKSVETNRVMARHTGVNEIDVRGTNESEDIESAYAADNDDETDIGSLNDGEDTISALSDSFGHPSHSKRYRKERRFIEKKTQEKSVPAKFMQPAVKPDMARQRNANSAGKRSDRNLSTERKHTQQASIEQFPHHSSFDYAEPPRIRPGRSRQARAKFMEKDSLLPRYAGTYTDDDSSPDSSSWDDDTVTTNPSLCISADEKGGMYRYRRETRIV